MQDLMIKLYATMIATASAPRDEKGQTSAEYVGILVFVAMVAAAIIAFNDTVSSTLEGFITSALEMLSPG